MTRGLATTALVGALSLHGCTCGEPEVTSDAAIDPMDAPAEPAVDATTDAWERIDAAREDTGPDAYDPSEDPCVIDPRGVDCARESIRALDAALCEAERACGRPISDEACEVYFPVEGGELSRASEDELTLIRLGLIEYVPETIACLRERQRTCSLEDPATCGPMFRPVATAMAGDPCRHDAQCGDEMFCRGLPRASAFHGMELCTVGECTARLADGEPCEHHPEYDIDRPIGPCGRESICHEGTCRRVARSRPAALREPCGFVREGESLVHSACAEGACWGVSEGPRGVCLPIAALGESCTDATCGLEARCAGGVCAPRARLGDPCPAESEGTWCDFEALGSACVDGVCTGNPRGINDTCSWVQPCNEGVCARAQGGGVSTCQLSLGSPEGGLCRGDDGDCLDGVCCAWMCVSVHEAGGGT